jgi:hypothetical protein
MGHTVEQRNLLWGSEVTALLPGRGGKPPRVLHVDDEHIGFATALALVVEHGRRAAGSGRQARCPRCGREGPIDRDFGTRVLNGRRRPQSWCRACRAAHLEQERVSQRAEAGWLF